MKDVDTTLLAGLGLLGIGIFGLGFSGGRSWSEDAIDSSLEKIVDQKIGKLDQRLSEIDHRHTKASNDAFDHYAKRIKELEESMASRIWELEKRAGLAPTGDDDAD